MTKKNEKRDRVRAANLLLRSGYSYTDTVRVLEAQYSVCEKTAKNYVKEARTNYVLTPEHLTEDAYIDYERSEYAIRMAFDKKDLATILKAINLRKKQRQDLMRHGTTQAQYSPDDSLSTTLADVFEDFKLEKD